MNFSPILKVTVWCSIAYLLRRTSIEVDQNHPTKLTVNCMISEQSKSEICEQTLARTFQIDMVDFFKVISNT